MEQIDLTNIAPGRPSLYIRGSGCLNIYNPSSKYCETKVSDKPIKKASKPFIKRDITSTVYYILQENEPFHTKKMYKVDTLCISVSPSL